MKKSKIRNPQPSPPNPSPRGRGALIKNCRSVRHWVRVLIICLSFILCPLSLPSVAAPGKEYDGLWFMGFNLHKDIFGDKNGPLVRKAFYFAIDRAYIAKKIMGDTTLPTGVIPKGMEGFEAEAKGYPYNVKEAKRLMQKAGYSLKDARLKNLSLLHTDGQKTIEIAKFIQRALAGIGIKLDLIQVKYEAQDKWLMELESGRYHLFLMGKKEFALKEGTRPDTASLLRSLFHSQGDANFTFYHNARVDSLLDELEVLGQNLTGLRQEKLKEINRIIMSDPPVVNLFYITRL